MSTPDELLDRFVHFFNGSQFDEGRADYAAGGYLEEIGTGRRLTPDEAAGVAREWKAAFPDAAGRITNKIVSGATAAAEIVWTGTHRGPLMGMPATSRSVTVRATVWIEADHGKIGRAAHYIDIAGMMAQLGVAPGAPSRT